MTCSHAYVHMCIPFSDLLVFLLDCVRLKVLSLHQLLGLLCECLHLLTMQSEVRLQLLWEREGGEGREGGGEGGEGGEGGRGGREGRKEGGRGGREGEKEGGREEGEGG